MLLNPPAVSAGTRTRNAVKRVATVMGYDRVVMANLCAVPTPSVVEINALGADAWSLARPDLETSIALAAAVLAGWGVAGLSGEARKSMRSQVEWLCGCAQSRGIESIWTVGGEPRHPSRWHQYVADKYARTSAGSFEERIKQVLVPVPVGQLIPAPSATHDTI